MFFKGEAVIIYLFIDGRDFFVDTMRQLKINNRI